MESAETSLDLSSHELFLIASEIAFDGVAIHEEGRILFVNQTFVNLIGYPAANLVGRMVYDLVDESSRPELLRRVRTGSTEPYELRGVRKDGSVFWAELRAKNITIRGRRLRLAAVRDITEHKEKDRALAAEVRVYQKGQELLLELARASGLAFRDFCRKATEAVTESLDVERASVWMFTEDRSALALVDLFRKSQREHCNHFALKAKDYPAYFDSLSVRRVLAADDARADPRTAVLKDYLETYGIGAMLDVPIWHKGAIAGVLCCEHVGGPRAWSPPEQQYASSLADLVSTSLEVEERLRTEEELRKREEHLRLITSQMPAMLWTTDTDLRVTSGVGTGLTPLNVSPLRRGERIFELLQSRDSAHPLVRPQLAALQGESISYDGDWQGRHYQVHIEPFRDARGRIVGTIGLAQDITERKLAEEEIRLLHGITTAMNRADTSDDALRTAIELICRETGWEIGQVWLPDDNGTRLELAAPFYVADPRLLKFREASLGLRLSRDNGIQGRAWSAKEPCWINDVTAEPGFIRTDAARAVALNTALAVPVIDEGRVVAVLDFLMHKRRVEDDRTTRMVAGAAAQLGWVLRKKSAETERQALLARQQALFEEAQRKAAELQAILDNMVDAVLVCNQAGEFRLVNAAARSQLGAETGFDFSGKTIAEVSRIYPLYSGGQERPLDQYPLVRALRGETILEEESELQPADGHIQVVRVSAGPIRDPAGEVIGAVAVARDITEIAEFNRMKDSFIRVTAHELKTPLSIMKGYAQTVLRTNHEFPAHVRKMLEAIDLGATRIVRLVNDLLDVSRSGSITIDTGAAEHFDLAECVRETIQSQTLEGTHDVRLVRADPAPVRGDRGRIVQVVLNLLQNASKYSPLGSPVTVEVMRQGGEVVVSVADQGLGIPAAKQPLIFQRFFRAHAGTPYDVGGMGVGLYISREIIDKHGGRIWFTSREGEGSTFSFALPLAAD